MDELVVASKKPSIQEHIYAVEGEFHQQILVEPDVAADKPTIQIPRNVAYVDKYSLQLIFRVQDP